MEKPKNEKNFVFKKFFKKDKDEIKKLKEIKKRIRKIKTFEDLDALEEELIEIGVIDREELEKLKNRKRKKSEKEMFEERLRCNIEIINRTILIGKQHKIRERQQKDEELIQNKEERSITGTSRKKDRDEKVR